MGRRITYLGLLNLLSRSVNIIEPMLDWSIKTTFVGANRYVGANVDTSICYCSRSYVTLSILFLLLLLNRNSKTYEDVKSDRQIDTTRGAVDDHCHSHTFFKCQSNRLILCDLKKLILACAILLRGIWLLSYYNVGIWNVRNYFKSHHMRMNTKICVCVFTSSHRN